jgi:uncharacterized protein YkwD
MRNKIILFISVLFLAAILFALNKPSPIAPPPVEIPIEKPVEKPKITKPEPKPDTIQQKLIVAHNKIRKSHGKGELKEDPQLMQIAQKWADHMAKTGILRHQSLNFGGGFSGMGENIAMGQKDVEEVMRDWMKSPGHRRNILSNYSHIGVGIAEGKRGTFWCVDFGGKNIRVILKPKPLVSRNVH